MAQALSLPPLPEGLTAEWLTSLLGGVGLAKGARVVSVTRSQVGEGVGMMSELSRLHLQWSTSDEHLPPTLIAKYASTNPTNRAAALGFHVYEREVRYFLEVKARSTVRSPLCHFGQLDRDSFLILMEDLGDYRIGSQAAGAGLEDTELAIDQLARLHAPLWNKVDNLDWVPRICNSYHADGLVMMANSGWDNMVRTFGEHVPQAIRERRDKILAAIPKLQAAMDQGARTFIHGDFRLDNLLFGQKSDHAPVMIIDWQGPLQCKSVVDLALLLGQNTHIEVRRQHERALLQRYVDGLAALGVRYNLADAWQDYRDALLYQWCYAATVTGSLDSSNPRSSAWMSQCVARQCAATMDHNLLAELPRFL